ncbi:hypothetical protein [Streptomyces hilarionis]|uniref:hypothetical protein n=1 Tax=Streptomyces hilarionis TaxID=2839954 RepID=UPI002119D96B|nr:hypothetical protein [Streptomyces hilarionis]MCQ9134994.1 hypothetical protein [Streptomyces hilarionis]
MNRDFAVAYTCCTIAFLELAVATWLATADQWWTAAFTACTAPSLLLLAALARRAYRRARAEAKHAEQPACGEAAAPLVPCCSLWAHSDGQAHGLGCTRAFLPPPLPRRDTHSLDEPGAAAFDDITRQPDDPTA